MQAEADSGAMPGVTTERLAEMAKLKREDAELRETNDISKAAASLFARELDRRRPASVGTIDDAALLPGSTRTAA